MQSRAGFHHFFSPTPHLSIEEKNTTSCHLSHSLSHPQESICVIIVFGSVLNFFSFLFWFAIEFDPSSTADDKHLVVVTTQSFCCLTHSLYGKFIVRVLHICLCRHRFLTPTTATTNSARGSSSSASTATQIPTPLSNGKSRSVSSLDEVCDKFDSMKRVVTLDFYFLPSRYANYLASP
jgi:hypothetical protein